MLLFRRRRRRGDAARKIGVGACRPHVHQRRVAPLRQRRPRRHDADRLGSFEDRDPGANVDRRLVRPVRLRRGCRRSASVERRPLSGLGEARLRKPKTAPDPRWPPRATGRRFRRLTIDARSRRRGAGQRHRPGRRGAQGFLDHRPQRRGAGRGHRHVSLRRRRRAGDRGRAGHAPVPCRVSGRHEDNRHPDHDPRGDPRSGVHTRGPRHLGRPKEDPRRAEDFKPGCTRGGRCGHAQCPLADRRPGAPRRRDARGSHPRA